MVGTRWSALALLGALALAATPRAAHADDERPAPRPFPRWSRGLFAAGHAGAVAGISGGGFGVDIEVARGLGRWQLFGDALFLSTSLAVNPTPATAAAAPTTPAPTPAPTPVIEGPDGFETRLGLGARRVVRSFEPDHSAAIEMYLEGGVGLDRIWWNGGGTLTRPDVAFGGGWQIRMLERPRIAVRLAVKVIIQAPVDDAAMTGACLAACPASGHHGADSGFLAQFGVWW